MHISQSGVSAQVRQLEHEVGAPLLDRSARAARLTGAAGPRTRPLTSSTAWSGARLTVGMVTACTVGALFGALARFHGAHPGVAVTLVEDDSAGLAARVRSGAPDLALLGAAGSPPRDLESLTVISEGLAAAAVPGHPLLAGPGPVVRLADLAPYPLVSLPPGTGVRAVLDQASAAAGVRLGIALAGLLAHCRQAFAAAG